MTAYTYPANKFYWGHYLNLGRHHATVILQSILEKCKIAETIDEDSWKTEKEGNNKLLQKIEAVYLKGKPEIQVLFRDELRHHFPFLRCLDKETTEQEEESNKKQATWQDHFNAIKILFALLSDRRNVCNHHDHDPLNAIAAEEAALFEAIWQKVFTEMINRKADGSKKHANDQYPEKYYGNTKQEREDSLVHLRDWAFMEAGDFSEKGLTFLVCLFLERTDAVLFVSNLKDFPANAKTNRDAFSHFSCRLPQPKLESSNSKLDALNELARCPNELWQLLSSDNQERFFTESHDSDDDEPTGTYMRRGKDSRFEYFALQYVDETNLLGDLSFQLHLGKIRLSTYSKTMVGVLQNRELVRDIYVYGKLKDYKDKEPADLFGEDIASRIEQYAPKYAFLGNNIAMKTTPSDIEVIKTKLTIWIEKGKIREDLRRNEALADALEKVEVPIVPIEATETPSNETITNSEPPPDADNQADYILSKHDVFGLVFYAYLQKQGKIRATVAEYLAKYKTQLSSFINEVQTKQIKPISWKFNRFIKERPAPLKTDATEVEKEKYECDTSDYERYLEDLAQRTQRLQGTMAQHFPYVKTTHLPDKILHYLLSYKTKTPLQIAKAKIQAKEHETYLLLKDWKKNEAENLPIKDYKPRAGELGAWLAKDMIYLMPFQNDDPKTNRGRPNDQQANKLQKLLAIYDTNELWDYFKELGLLNAENRDLAHPFLNRLKKVKAQLLSIQDFYQFYLNKRTAFFKSFFPFDMKTKVKSCKLDTEPDALAKNNYWLKLDLKKVVETDPLLQKDYTKPPFLLPRGIFNEIIIAVLRSGGYNITKSGKGHNKQASLTHCIELFCNNDKQDFYTFERVFKFKKTDEEGILRTDLETSYNTELKRIEKQIIKAAKQNRPHEDLTIEKVEIERKQAQIIKKIAEQDKTIRLVMAQDRLMLLILKDWWSHETEHKLDTTDFKLANLEAFLNTPYDMEVNLPYKTNERETITNADGTTKQQYKMACKIITAKLPLKRYGDFRKTVKDIRLRTEEKNGKIESGLLLWFDAERIPLARLKKELEYYNNHRHEVTKAIVNWEYDLMETKQEVVRPDYSKSKGKIKYKAANYTDHLPYLHNLMLAKADRDALRNLCTNIVVHTHNLYIGNKAAKRILLTGLSTNDVKTYIEAQAIATPISLNNLNDKLAEITNSFYQNPKTIRAADRLTIDLYDGILTLYENEMPVITHLKMLRNKFAHNQIRYDAILDDSTTILRVQNGQETEGCQAQPNSTNRYIEEVCLIDKNKLITTQLIKYTTEQYNAL